MMRELHTRFGRENLGFVWIIAEPLLFTGAVVTMWSLMRGPYDHGIPLVAFMLTGYMPLVLWRHALSRSILCFRSNSSLLYHRQVSVLDLLASRIILEILGCLIAYIAAAFLFFSLGMYELPVDWGLFLLGWGYHILYAIGTALIISCISEMYEWAEKLIGPFSYIMVPLCGFVYMVDWLPYRVQKMAMFMPSVNAYEILRSGQFGPSVRVHYDLCVRNLYLFRINRHRLDALQTRPTLHSHRMIRVKNVSKSYHVQGRKNFVLKDISFDLKPGRKLALIGRNGAGKSTLIRLLGKIEMPTKGAIEHHMSVSWPLGFGGAFQGSLTGIDNMRFLSRVYQTDFDHMRAFVEDFAELGKFLYQPVKIYSSGMRARLAFALSIAIKFDCYLIDEVILVGDQRFHDRCREHLFNHDNDRSLVLASHDGEFVKKVCDEAILLLNGQAHHYTDIEEALHAYHESTSSRSVLSGFSHESTSGEIIESTNDPATTSIQSLVIEDADTLADTESKAVSVHYAPLISKDNSSFVMPHGQEAPKAPNSELMDFSASHEVSPELFVQALYRHVLRREPDAGGFLHYVQRLKDIGFAKDLANLLRDFINSDEALAITRGHRGEVADLHHLPPIRHVLSLGAHCYTSFMLKKYGLKRYSGPFDWIFSSSAMAAHCIDDDFQTFLNAEYFEPVPINQRMHADANRVEHRYYRERFGIRYVFNHHDVHEPADFAYMCRCVERFRRILMITEAKLFVQCSKFTETSISEFSELSNVIDKRTSNGLVFVFLISDERSRCSLPEISVAASAGNHRAFLIHPVSHWQPLNFEDPIDELLIMQTISKLTIQLDQAPF